tara:strand:- start:1077 stop:1652 length:576 start_codon:yes stop_codon:yes gene_type:complete
MNKIITIAIIFLLGMSTSFSQILIEGDIFKVNYSEKYEQPLEVYYTVECPLGNASRKGMDFHKVDSIKTSDNNDYKNNVWDKGHMAPAAAFNCDEETLLKTFSYLNCALQHQGLNRGPWKELERFERDLAKLFEVNVKIEIVFDKNSKKLETGATVPSYFIKTIYFENYEHTYKFPNKDVKGKNWYTFKIK